MVTLVFVQTGKAVSMERKGNRFSELWNCVQESVFNVINCSLWSCPLFLFLLAPAIFRDARQYYWPAVRWCSASPAERLANMRIFTHPVLLLCSYGGWSGGLFIDGWPSIERQNCVANDAKPLSDLLSGYRARQEQ